MGSWYSAKYADMICILSSLHYVIAESKAFVFAFKNLFTSPRYAVLLRGAPLRRKIMDPHLSFDNNARN